MNSLRNEVLYLSLLWIRGGRNGEPRKARMGAEEAQLCFSVSHRWSSLAPTAREVGGEGKTLRLLSAFPVGTDFLISSFISFSCLSSFVFTFCFWLCFPYEEEWKQWTKSSLSCDQCWWILTTGHMTPKRAVFMIDSPKAQAKNEKKRKFWNNHQ